MCKRSIYLIWLGFVLALSGTAPASENELPDPNVTACATPYLSVSNIFDNDVNTYYASTNLGVDTYIDFDFGTPTVIGGFSVVQTYYEVYRTDGANLIFSNNSDFSNPVATVFVDTSGAWAYELGNLANSTVTVKFAPIIARYVKYDVTTIGYPNPPYTYHGYVGATEMTFLLY